METVFLKGKGNVYLVLSRGKLVCQWLASPRTIQQISGEAVQEQV